MLDVALMILFGVSIIIFAVMQHRMIRDHDKTLDKLEGAHDHYLRLTRRLKLPLYYLSVPNDGEDE